jgi:hypothetical protein
LFSVVPVVAEAVDGSDDAGPDEQPAIAKRKKRVAATAFMNFSFKQI